MTLITAENLKIYGGSRLLITQKLLQIQEKERIGLIGPNGSGKSTLLQILAGLQEPEQGEIQRNSSTAYLNQSVTQTFSHLSGGEEKRKLLHEAFQENPLLLLADEPENHLDIQGIQYLIRQLSTFSGAILLVSHDRFLLNEVCEQIWEIDQGTICMYRGNYYDYLLQKEITSTEIETAYEKYTKEKRRIKKAIQDTQKRSSKVKKAPSRMGNSEARLHKMGDQRAKANLDKITNQLRSRLDHLEVAKKPHYQKSAFVDLPIGLKIYSPFILEGRQISKAFADQIIFQDIDFSLKTGSKTALIGPNGSGKTTLLEMIYHRSPTFLFPKNVKVGYLSQFFSDLDLNRSILENVQKVSIYDSTFDRLTLARLLFSGEDVYKPCNILSGGERTKVSLAMLMLGNYNLLLLDEPTNHLDLSSIEAIESSLHDYPGTVLFSSHDQAFVRSVATEIWEFHSGSLIKKETPHSP